MLKIAFLFSILTITFSTVNHSVLEENYFAKRSITSEKDFKNCLDHLKIFSKFNEKFINPKTEKIITHLKKQTLDYRLSLFEFLLRLNIKSNSVRRDLADLLNSSLKENLINEEMLNTLILKINKEITYLHLSKNGSVYVDLLEETASIDSLKELNQLSFITPSVKDNFISTIAKFDITIQELNSIKQIKTKIDLENSKIITSFISYVHTLKPDDRKIAIQNIDDIFRENSNNKLIQKFKKYQLQINNFIEKEKNNLIEKENLNEVEAISKATSKSEIYERLIYGCRARTLSTERLATNKKFILTMIGSELLIDSNAYIYMHKDQEKDLNWYKKFSFDMLLDIGNILMSSRISMNPSKENLSKMIQYYISGSISTIPSAISYHALFKKSDADKEKAYNEIMASPEFKKELSELINYLDKNEEKIRLTELMVPVIESNNKKIPNDTETKELLFKALTKELYVKQQGEWIHTDDVGLDRYVFDRIWSTQSAVRNIAVNLLMYDALCMGELNPKKAYALALSYFVINKAIFDPTYNYMRRRAINQ